MRRTLLICGLLVVVALAVASEETIHVLKRGETIYTLARRYGVSADYLLQYNAIDDPTRLAVGTEIRVPGTYLVEDGDYVYAIARRLGVDPQELLDSNGLGPNDVVRPGDVLLVPAQAETAAGAASGESVEHIGSTEADSAGTVTTGTAVTQSAAETENELNSARGTTGASVGTEDAAAGAKTVVWPHPGEREDFDGRFRGVIMRGASGDAFRSVTTGVVSFVGPFTSFGKLILVRSENGYLYGYAGADRVDVVPGEHVTNGTVLGSVGVSPAFHAAAVLFTVWRNNRYINPADAPRG